MSNALSFSSTPLRVKTCTSITVPSTSGDVYKEESAQSNDFSPKIVINNFVSGGNEREGLGVTLPTRI